MDSDVNVIRFVFYGFASLYGEDKCLQFFDLLERNDIRPLKFGDSEHCMNKYSAKNLLQFWKIANTEDEGFIFLKGDKFNIRVDWGGALPYNMGGRLSTLVISNPDKIIKLAKDLYYWYEAHYGYVQQLLGADLSSPGLSIFDCLGGIGWANFFGEPYVDLWGKDKILNAPAWKIEPLDDGGFLLLTTDSPFSERSSASKAECILLNYLGKEYFYKQPDRDTMKNEEILRYLCNPKDYETYIAPDFTKYIYK